MAKGSYTKPKPTANQTAARRSGKSSWRNVGESDPRDAEYTQWASHDARGNYVPGYFNQRDYNAFFANGGVPAGINAPASPGSPGGGGYGYGGGGGGGGGGAAMTQAVFDAMLKALSQQGQQQTYTPLNLPAFRGQNIAAFNAAPYQQAQQSLDQAVAADTANVNANAQNTTNALNTNFTNDYANATVTPGTAQAPVGAGLTGGGANQQAANDVNADNSNSQAAFSNLLQVLAANANQGQASRLNQVQMDKGTALNQIGAQNLGLGAGINQARTQGRTQWSQQDAERRYQNSLMAQQWQREQAMTNNQGVNATNQANVQMRNQQMQTRLQPILDLIASGGKLDMTALLKMLGGTA